MKLNKAEQEEIAGLLEKLAEITAAFIVETARFNGSSLNHRFEWDDKKAAYQHRLDVARDILQSFRITVTSASSPDRPVDFAITPGVVSSGYGYRDVRLVMGDEDSAAAQLGYEWRTLSALLLRFSSLCSLSQEHLECGRWARKVRAEGDKRAARLARDRESAVEGIRGDRTAAASPGLAG